MAGKVVDIIFRMKDEFSQGMGKMKSSLAESSKQLGRASRQIQSMGRSMQRMGSSLTKSVTVPIVGAGTVAVKKFAEVDKTMSLVNATMKNSSKEADILNKAMEAAAANSTFGMNDAAQASLNFARGGWDAEQAANALAPAMNLAAGEGGNLDTVSAGLMATMNSFGASAEEAQGYANIFAQACNNSALDVDSLSNSMSVAAPIFKTSGGTLEDAALAMGTMANAGIDANVAANSLKTGIARLASPTDSAAAAMKQLGIDAFDSKGNLKDMAQLQGELSQAFSGLTGEEKEAAAAAIFGKNQMAPWLALIGTAPEEVDKLSDSLDRNKNTTGEMADAMMSGFGGSIEKLKSSFDVFMTSMGRPIAEVLTPLIEKIQGVVDKLNNMDDAQKKQIVRFALLAASVGPALLIFGKMTVGVGKVVGIMSKLGSVIKKGQTLLALLNVPWLAVVGIFAAIVAAGVLIWKNWDRIKTAGQRLAKSLQPVFNALKKTWNSVKKTIIDGVQAIWSRFTAAVAKIRKPINSIRKQFNELTQTQAFKVFVTFMKDNFVARIKTYLSVLEGVFTAVWSAITGIISAAIDTIGGVINGLLEIFNGLITFLTGFFTGNWRQAWEGVKQIFKGVFDTIGAIAKGVMNAVISVINGAINGINRIKVNIPDWVPKVGGRSFGVNLPTIPKLEVGTPSWIGGLAMMNEKGGEIVDLPRGSRVYPHDESVRRAYNDGRRSGGVTINIPKLADAITIREDADIDRLTSAITNKVVVALANVG